MSFQKKVHELVMECLGQQIALDKKERNYRFLEESLELVQSLGCTREECLTLVDYVYSRSSGEPYQEVGGVMLTLAELCTIYELDMRVCAERELDRAWKNMDKIRAKQAAKPKLLDARAVEVVESKNATSDLP